MEEAEEKSGSRGKEEGKTKTKKKKGEPEGGKRKKM